MTATVQNLVRSAPAPEQLRVLVAIASYGHGNDKYLHQLLAEYRAMPFSVDIVILSNIEKRPSPEIECLVGLPNKNPWSLPFSHKRLFADRLDRYDLFIYSEDDILVTEKNIRAFLDASYALREDEIPGFLLVEKGTEGNVSYPQVHGFFHWDCESVRVRDEFTLAHFTNQHAACYLITRKQLAKAIQSGGFVVAPHEGKYDLLCSAATDPYTQCGFTELVPVSHLEEFSLHHLPNKYIGRMGVDGNELDGQIETLKRIAANEIQGDTLLNGETSLWRGMYSKLYYEAVHREAIARIPASARNILSVGCGWGATEMSLVENGMRVVAVPLDPVICSRASTKGVEVVYGGLEGARAQLEGMQFDCILYLNILHLVRDPAEVLNFFKDFGKPGSPIIVQSPNMRSLPELWEKLRNGQLNRPLNFPASGVHFSSKNNIRRWCERAGYSIARTEGLLHRRVASLSGLASSTMGLPLAPEIISVATRN
ncbi:class I SAM-dependent methyltransferase [Bradyrhizobium sp. SYSU BS000235]|uniref:class I SAM-dependent methyltransferase n=1 Tax=Bradyrhizobium sp. SYSU BS000235 TaxID=3411332 RepID=UPI003C769729